MNRFTRRLVVALLLGVAIYAAAVLYAGFRDIAQSLGRFRWWTFGAALVLATANYGLRFYKWEFYLRRLEVRDVPRVESLLVFLSGFVLTITPGKVGEVFKSAVLEELRGVPLARTAPIVIAERLTDVIGVVVLIAIGSSGFSGGLLWAGLGGAAVGLGLVLILWTTPALALLGWLERHRRLGRFVPKLREFHTSLRLLADPAALLWPSALSVLAWGCEGVALYLLIEGFGYHAPVTLAVFFYSTASLAGALIPVPGGLGVVEAMLREQLVQLAGVPAPAATASMILVRIATLWWAVLVGFAALGLLKRRHPGLLANEQPA